MEELEQLHVTITIEREFDLCIDVPVKIGNTLMHLKLALIELNWDIFPRDPSGNVQVDEFGLGLLPKVLGDPVQPLPNNLRLSGQHRSLCLCQIQTAYCEDNCCATHRSHSTSSSAVVAYCTQKDEDSATKIDTAAAMPTVEITLCFPSLDGMQELYSVDCKYVVEGPTVTSLRQLLEKEYRVIYCSKLRFEVVTGDGDPAALGDKDFVPHSPAEVSVAGPGSVVQMLLMALRRKGPPMARRHCQAQTKSTPKKTVADSVGLDAVKAETFLANFMQARATQAAVRVVFLDVDGVLNCGSSMEGLRADCIERLAHLVHSVDARIVLSTTWRCNDTGRLDILHALVEAGLKANCIVGQTPEKSEMDMCAERAAEISEWLDDNAGSIATWVVLDDIDLSPFLELDGHVVRTDFRKGLSDADVEKARLILMRNPLVKQRPVQHTYEA